MLRSLPVSANFVFKLHVTALEERTAGIHLYPVMDGVYVVTPDRDEMRTFLSAVYTRLAICLTTTAQHEHRFLPKCAVAHGPVIHGSDVNPAASAVFQRTTDNERYKDSVLLGMPMVYAAQCEPLAPPFGVYVHASAPDFLEPQERKQSHVWWHWFEPGQSQEAQDLRNALPLYFDWCDARAGAIDYDPARIRVHRAQSEQYLVDA
ncbi:MAG: hypothetical protein PF636_08845 [Actinomycetota bacterium]|nr:hypothetical protein [Actinomycetota bacterium]